MDITKIVITGGPCAGKSAAMSWIENAFTNLGYTVLLVHETATELITGGVAPWTCGTVAEYQKCQLKLQLEKEKVFEKAAYTMEAEKVLIVCDRGTMDNKAYLSEAEFEDAMKLVGLNEVELRDSYDAVFHLVSAAKGSEEFYTTRNNTARRETAMEAAAIDDKLISAWAGHPHLRVIACAPAFEEKMKHLIDEIRFFLGEPEPLEIERKFLIEYPDIKWLESNPFCKRVEISQTYLESNAGAHIRIRQRGVDGSYIYIQTIKHKISDIKRIEVEKRLSRDEYTKLLTVTDKKYTISKNRYCLVHENQYFELDVFPFWDDKAVLEIELTHENADIVFPKEIKIIKEVSNDASYNNSYLAKVMGQ
ncbi:MAG: CYTH domain-containing protein [Ruminococcaceae bacterium]|nr:CYTH domain-containing protein [Oscillospiraceae bacterium]